MNSEDESALTTANSVPVSMGILKTFPSPSTIKVTDIVERIMTQREMFTKRYKSKAAKEADYVANKEFIQEQ